MKHIGTCDLETERLLLRKISVNDAQAMYNNWASDDIVTKYVTWPTHKNVEETKGLLAIWEKEYENDNCYRWVIELKDEKKVIGTIDVCRVDEGNETAEIGYVISRDCWNKGIVTEAAKKVVEYLLKEAGFYRVEAQHHLDNPASGKVMQKIGMKYEGVLRGARIVKGEHIDVAMYAILKID
jgi:ribosomal-protein-alanine N-acetyltransferase